MSPLLWTLIVLLVALIIGLIAWVRSGNPGTAEESKRLIPSGLSQEMSVETFGRDARAFLIVKHNKHGYLVLNAFKERKGQHGQLPGGRIDLNEDVLSAAVREFFEETGILVDKSRILPLWPIGSKHFLFLQITDADQVKGGSQPTTGEAFRMKLSGEHVSFAFFKDVHAAAKAVLRHSGGTPADALERFALSQEGEA